jgi:hypothetical protein
MQRVAALRCAALARRRLALGKKRRKKRGGKGGKKEGKKPSVSMRVSICTFVQAKQTK